MAVQIDATPSDSLIDEQLTITIEGLSPGQAVTVRATYRIEGVAYRGEATFVATEDGTIDLAEHAPESGDYSGVRPMGLVQFARQVDDDSIGSDDDLEEAHRLRLTVCDGETVLAETTTVRRYLDPDVDRVVVEDEHDTLVGDFLVPPGDGPHPGVLYLGGSEGGVPTNTRAKLLASHGYAVLALAYFQSEPGSGGGDDRALDRLPETLTDVPITYFDRGFAWLGRHERTQTDSLGVVGASRGTEPAAFVAQRNDAVSALVLLGSLSNVFCSFQAIGQPAWLVDGDPYPFLTNNIRLRDGPRYLWRKLTGRGVPFSWSFVAAIEEAPEQQVEVSTLPVESADAPILLISGEEDELVDSTWMSERLVDRLDASDYEYQYDHCSYATGHLISVPYLPVRDRAIGDEEAWLGMPMAFGGDPEGYAEADVDAWQRQREFLDLQLCDEQG